MFQLRHFPALFLATTFTFGGAWPLWNASAAMREFGLLEHIVSSPEADAVFIVYSSRMTVMGLAIYMFYSKGLYSSIDILFLTLGWAGLIDGYVCWLEGVPGRAAFRATSGFVLAALGYFNINSGGRVSDGGDTQSVAGKRP